MGLQLYLDDPDNERIRFSTYDSETSNDMTILGQLGMTERSIPFDALGRTNLSTIVLAIVVATHSLSTNFGRTSIGLSSRTASEAFVGIWC